MLARLIANIRKRHTYTQTEIQNGFQITELFQEIEQPEFILADVLFSFLKCMYRAI